MLLKEKKAAFIALLVFILLVFFGLHLAAKKPLWNDELYSQVKSIQGRSYAEILLGRVSEGNNSPLFYIIQKFWEDICQYQTPSKWNVYEWEYRHPFSHVFLRIFPVMSMAAGVAILVFFFTAYFNIWLGVYALLVSLSSFMVWAYAFEARPYALWFLLTMVQGVCFLAYLLKGETDRRLGLWLKVVHLLLAFTAIFSLVQITAVALLWWFLGNRRVRDYVFLWLIPVAIILFYYVQAPKYEFYFVDGIKSLIGASLPLDRLFILSVFFLFWFFNFIPDKLKRSAGYFGVFLAMILAGCLGVLLLFKLKTTGSGFQISNRYFICLAPIGIIATTIFSYYMVESLKGVLKVGFLIGLMGLLIWRTLHTAALVGSLHKF